MSFDASQTLKRRAQEESTDLQSRLLLRLRQATVIVPKHREVSDRLGAAPGSSKVKAEGGKRKGKESTNRFDPQWD